MYLAKYYVLNYHYVYLLINHKLKTKNVIVRFCYWVVNELVWGRRRKPEGLQDSFLLKKLLASIGHVDLIRIFALYATVPPENKCIIVLSFILYIILRAYICAYILLFIVSIDI